MNSRRSAQLQVRPDLRDTRRITGLAPREQAGAVSGKMQRGERGSRDILGTSKTPAGIRRYLDARVRRATKRWLPHVSDKAWSEDLGDTDRERIRSLVARLEVPRDTDERRHAAILADQVARIGEMKSLGSLARWQALPIHGLHEYRRHCLDPSGREGDLE